MVKLYLPWLPLKEGVTTTLRARMFLSAARAVWLGGAPLVFVDLFVFWVVAVPVVGLVWLIEYLLVHLCDDFALFIGCLFGMCLF